MSQMMKPGTAWFYITGPTSTEMVREIFDMAFLNSVAQIVEEKEGYSVLVDMGRSCYLLEQASKEMEKNGCVQLGPYKTILEQYYGK